MILVLRLLVVFLFICFLHGCEAKVTFELVPIGSWEDEIISDHLPIGNFESFDEFQVNQIGDDHQLNNTYQESLVNQLNDNEKDLGRDRESCQVCPDEILTKNGCRVTDIVRKPRLLPREAKKNKRKTKWKFKWRKPMMNQSRDEAATLLLPLTGSTLCYDREEPQDLRNVEVKRNETNAFVPRDFELVFNNSYNNGVNQLKGAIDSCCNGAIQKGLEAMPMLRNDWKEIFPLRDEEGNWRKNVKTKFDLSKVFPPKVELCEDKFKHLLDAMGKPSTSNAANNTRCDEVTKKLFKIPKTIPARYNRLGNLMNVFRRTRRLWNLPRKFSRGRAHGRRHWKRNGFLKPRRRFLSKSNNYKPSKELISDFEVRDLLDQGFFEFYM